MSNGRRGSSGRVLFFLSRQVARNGLLFSKRHHANRGCKFGPGRQQSATHARPVSVLHPVLANIIFWRSCRDCIVPCHLLPLLQVHQHTRSFHNSLLPSSTSQCPLQDIQPLCRRRSLRPFVRDSPGFATAAALQCAPLHRARPFARPQTERRTSLRSAPSSR